MQKAKTFSQPDDKYENTVRMSMASTHTSSERQSQCSSPIKVIGFRNFTPTGELKGFEQRSKSISYSTFTTRDSFSINLLGSPARMRPIEALKSSKIDDRKLSDALEGLECGPFFIFTYSEFVKSGHFRTVDSLENIEFTYQEQGHISPHHLLEKTSSTIIELKETDCVYIISKEQLDQKMSFFSISEKTWKQLATADFLARVNKVNGLVKEKNSFKKDELVVLAPISKGIHGEIRRGYCKHTRRYFGIQDIQIKTPEVLALLFQKLEAIAKVLESAFSNLANLVSLQLSEQKESEYMSLTVILDAGLGTLEDLSSFKNHNNKEWHEEELLKIVVSLLRLNSNLSDMNISLRDVSPANIAIDRDLKGLKILDFSLGHAQENESFATEIAGKPRFMAPEILLNIKRLFPKQVNSYLASLYSIGTSMLDLIGENNKKLSREDLLSYGYTERISHKYPALYEAYLIKLLNTQPLSRKEVVQGIKLKASDSSLIEEGKKAFEKFIAEQAFVDKIEVLADFETFLPYFWEIESSVLIERMEKNILEGFKSSRNSFKRVKKFFKKLVSLYESDRLNQEVIGALERFAEFIESECTNKSESDREDYNLLLLELHSKIGNLCKQEKNYNKALDNYEKASYYELLKEGDEKTFSNLASQLEIAYVYEKLGHDALALDTYIKTQDRFRQSFEADTNQLQEAIIYERIGVIYYRRGELFAAIDDIARAIVGYTTCYGANHESVANCERLLGDIHMKMGDEDQAIKHYRSYFSIYTCGTNKYEMHVGELMVKVGDYYKNKKEYEYAIENYERGLYIYEYHENKEEIYTLYESLAESYGYERKYLLAIKSLRLWCKLKASMNGEYNVELVPVMEEIANYLVKEGENSEALKEYSRILDILLLNEQKSDPEISNVLKKIVAICPLSFLVYRNLKRNSSLGGQKAAKDDTNVKGPLLISLNQIEDIRGVIMSSDSKMTLRSMRELITRECAYLRHLKYEFAFHTKSIHISEEDTMLLEECIENRDGLYYLMVKV